MKRLPHWEELMAFSSTVSLKRSEAIRSRSREHHQLMNSKKDFKESVQVKTGQDEKSLFSSPRHDFTCLPPTLGHPTRGDLDPQSESSAQHSGLDPSPIPHPESAGEQLEACEALELQAAALTVARETLATDTAYRVHTFCCVVRWFLKATPARNGSSITRGIRGLRLPRTHARNHWWLRVLGLGG